MKEIFALIGLLMVVYFAISVTEKFLVWIWTKQKPKSDVIDCIAQRDLKAGETIQITPEEYMKLLNQERLH